MKKECPSCAMEIDSNEKVCPICGYEFPEENKWMKYVVFILIVVFVLYFVL